MFCPIIKSECVSDCVMNRNGYCVLAVELPAMTAAIEQLADVIGDIRDRGYPDPALSAPVEWDKAGQTR